MFCTEVAGLSALHTKPFVMVAYLLFGTYSLNEGLQASYKLVQANSNVRHAVAYL